MPRQFTALTALLAVLATSLGSPLHACHSGRNYAVRYPVSAHRHVRVVQPVTIVRPAIIRPAIAPVQVVAAMPQPPRENLPTVPAGATLTLPANFLGPELGSVFMVFNEIKLPVQIHQWATTGVTITLPPMAIKDAVVIRLDIVLPNGNLGLTQKVRVTAPAPVVLHAVGPTSPLPTQDALQQAASAQRPRVTGPSVIPAAPLAAVGPSAAVIGQARPVLQASAASLLVVPGTAASSGPAATSGSPPGASPLAASPAALVGKAAATEVPLPVFGQPIVHPAGTTPPVTVPPPVTTPPVTTPPVTTPPMQETAVGTPGSPIVLPPAQPAAATLPGTVADNEDPLANNPILSEHQSMPAEVIAPQDVTASQIEPTVEEATAPAPEVDDEAASGGALSAIVRALTAQLRP